jgi:hypothetical protein
LELAIITVFIALLGFVLALYVAGRDRPKLKVTCALHVYVQPGEDSEEKETRYICIRAANHGRRSVSLASTRGRTSRGWFERTLTPGPVQLEPGQSHEFNLARWSIDLLDPELGQAEDLSLVDSLGKRYRVGNARKAIRGLQGK